MTEPARHLHVVDVETGEKLDGCPMCAHLNDQLKGAERDIRSWRARYADATRDREAEARRSRFWPVAQELHSHWRGVCSHPRSKWTADTFWLVEPHLRTYGEDMCRRAIDGAAYDPFTKKRKNGSLKRFDDWSLIFRDSMHVEDFANRAPRTVAA
jgi:hypothetical protein